MKTTPKRRSSAEPKVIGDYRLIKKLDAGGMGVVFKAIQQGTNIEVALKALPPKFARNAERLSRFRREVLACSRLNHPNLIRVIEQGCYRGIHFFTMEYFPGLSLKRMVDRDGPFSPERVIRVTRQIAAACSFYHAKKLVHRDIKPSNVLMNDGGHVKIIDFGLAKVRDLSYITRVSQAIGTARYLAPEILLGRPVDRRSDIYQVGLVLHELLTGIPVFPGKEPMTAVRAYVFNGVPLEKLGFAVQDKHWSRFLLNCLALDPADRYDSADELADDLERLARGEPLEPLKRGRAARAATQPMVPTATAPVREPTRPPQKRFKTMRQPRSAPPPARRRLTRLIPFGISILVAGLALAAWFGRPVRMTALHFFPGLEEVTVEWQTTRDVPTAIECARSDRNDFERFERPGARREHRLVIQGLEPGCRYRVHVLLPGDQRSAPAEFDTERPSISKVTFDMPGGGDPRISFETSPPLICEVEYRTATGISKVHTGYDPKTRHVTLLPSFDHRAPDNARVRVVFRQTGNGARHSVLLDVPRP